MDERSGMPGPVMAVDIGNSTVKCALLDPDRWQVVARTGTRPCESLSERLQQEWAELDGQLPEQCAISSVCPDANEAVEEFWHALGASSAPAYFQRDIPIPLETLTDEPERVGTDRLLCALGAREIAGAPCVVVGVGTAITVDLVDGRGRFAGGAIAPGPTMALKALNHYTACLPLVEKRKSKTAVEQGTEAAMRSGVYWMCRGGVDRLVGQVRAEAADWEAAVVVTGGEADLLLPLSTGSPLHWEPELIFSGMWKALQSHESSAV